MEKTQGPDLTEELSALFVTSVRKAIESFDALETKVATLNLLPMVLEKYKTDDPEFYYTTKSKLTDFAQSIGKQAEQLLNRLESKDGDKKSKEKESKKTDPKVETILITLTDNGESITIEAATERKLTGKLSELEQLAKHMCDAARRKIEDD